MKKMLVCKDIINNTLISTQVLDETENIKYVVIENVPNIEEKENEIGHYILQSNGSITIEYLPKTKSQLDIIQEQLSVLIDKVGL